MYFKSSIPIMDWVYWLIGEAICCTAPLIIVIIIIVLVVRKKKKKKEEKAPIKGKRTNRSSHKTNYK